MSNTKQTAVEWLAEQMMHPKIYNPYIEQAKQMEKEQIETAFNQGMEHMAYCIIDPKLPEHRGVEYYTQTYHAFKGELIQDKIGNLKPKKNEQ